MSRLIDARFHDAFPSTLQRTGPRRRITLAIAVALAMGAGFAASQDAASVRAAQAAGPELVRLLRFLAALKMAMAAAASGAAWWRLGYPASARLAASAIAACALMAFGSGVIWAMAHIVLGSALFYAGLLALLALGCAEGSGVREMAAGIGRHSRAPSIRRP